MDALTHISAERFLWTGSGPPVICLSASVRKFPDEEEDHDTDDDDDDDDIDANERGLEMDERIDP